MGNGKSMNNELDSLLLFSTFFFFFENLDRTGGCLSMRKFKDLMQDISQVHPILAVDLHISAFVYL